MFNLTGILSIGAPPEDGRVLAGSLPGRQLKWVAAWVELHRDELLADWELALNGEEPFRIAPLQ